MYGLSPTGVPQQITYGFCGESLQGQTAVLDVEEPVNLAIDTSTPGTSFSNAQDIWVTQVPEVDGGVGASSVYKLKLGAIFLPPPGDGGC